MTALATTSTWAGFVGRLCDNLPEGVGEEMLGISFPYEKKM